ncbi:MAG TPA: galactokinase [Verrucomicrobiales bacterium]|nr:galactokinase [Verrucomicrobiales bacterium]
MRSPDPAAAPSNPPHQAAFEAFVDQFGRAPTLLAAAPGRVNLIGEHIDYNDGFVLPAAIGRRTVLAAAARAGSRIEIHNLTNGLVLEMEASPPVPRASAGSWENYLRGVLHGLLEEGMPVPGFQAVLDSDLPPGGGLSSSAALEVCFATALESLAAAPLDPVHKALLCRQAEHDFAGVPCGIMDQFASVFGRQDHLLLLDCRSREFEWIPFPDPNISLLIANSNVRHSLADGEYAARRRQCLEALALLQCSSWRDARESQLETARPRLPDPLFRRARHVVTEIGRARRAAEAIHRADWDAVRQLMAASHASLRDDYEVSCPELDLLVEIAAPLPGVLGTRMTGGGFGGSTISLVRNQHLPAVITALHDRYFEQTGIEPSIFATRPGPGAALLPVPAKT